MLLRKRNTAAIFALGFLSLLPGADASEENALWKIQKLLLSKKYVDLTHEFAPGIPRWPGFPDETRKTIYWYEKRPDTMGFGLPSYSRMPGSGVHTLIRRRIS